MQILLEMTDDILIARLEGELDHHSAEKVRTTVDEALDAFYAKHLIFCFSDISFMDSAGIGVVMGRYNKVKDHGGMVYVTQCGDYVKRILSMSGIFTIAAYCDQTEDAIESCRQKKKDEANEAQNR